MRKYIGFALVLILAFQGWALGTVGTGFIYHYIDVVDDSGTQVTDINQVYIYLPGTTTTQTIYKDRALQSAITLPMTIASTNTTLVNGHFTWWGQDGYDFKIGNDVVTADNGHTQAFDSSRGKIVFPYYLQTIATIAWTDAQNISLGTDTDWVINGGATANLLKFTPASDGATVRFGLADGTKSPNLQWYTDNGLGFMIDESANTFTVTGLIVNANVSNNTAINLATGTSTGAVTIGGTGTQTIAIGNGAGAKTVNVGSVTGASATAIGGGTSDVTITSGDDIFLVTNTGTGDVISLVNTAGTSAASVVVTATAGGIDIDAAAALDVDIAGGQVLIASKDNAASAIALTANVGTSETIAITNTKGTSESALNIDATAGGIDIDFATGKNMAINGGQFIVTSIEDVASAINLVTNTGTSETIVVTNTLGTAAGAITLASTAGGVTITGGSGADIGITSTGKSVTLTATEAASDAIKLVGATGAGGITLDAGTGGIYCSGDVLKGFIRDINVVTAACDVVATESGMVLVSNGCGGANIGKDLIITLPTAVAGLQYTIYDTNVVAAADVYIKASSGDTISTGGAAEYLACKTDAILQSVTLVALDATRWEQLCVVGTWVADTSPDNAP